MYWTPRLERNSATGDCLFGRLSHVHNASKQYQGDVPSVYFAITWSIDSLHLYSRHGAAISVALARPACPVGDVKIILMFCLCKAVMLKRQGVRIRCLHQGSI